METTGGYASWINGKNERHNRIVHNMIRSGLIDSNQHESKWFCAAEKSAELYRCKIQTAVNNTLPHFEWYGKIPSIHELITFECDIYLITSSLKNLDDRTKEGYFMGYTNSRSIMKWWDPHTKKIKYCSSAKCNEHNNKFGKLWFPGSELITGKFYPSNIKY